MKLHQRLQAEKQMQMKGKEKATKFNWDKEIDDVSWE